MDIIEDDLNEMKKQFSCFEIIKESGGGIHHKADVFLYKKDYNKFEAKFYACMMPACSLGSDIYKNNEFQYSIGTWSGEWKENLKMLEGILEEISKKGLDAVKSQFDDEKLGLYKEKFLV